MYLAANGKHMYRESISSSWMRKTSIDRVVEKIGEDDCTQFPSRKEHG